jgi:hypothetical protein
MGLLDDAIREHLELKRQHGADPTEVERQEREALGATAPVRAPDAEPDEPTTAAPAEPEAVPEPAPDSSAPDEPAAVAAPPDPPAPDPDATQLYDAVADEPPAPLEAPEPAGPDTPSEAREADWLAEERGPDPDEAPPEEDVLEETPDFLQETPEHDRLWFEQKPPRNFDWDR